MKKSCYSVVVLVVLFLISMVGTSLATSSGVVSEGNISVFSNGKLSRNLSGVNPVDEGSLLVCEGKCMIRSGGVSLLAEDQAELAIANEDQGFNLFVKRGHVEFVISANAQKITFHTPEGVYSVADVVFNSSSNPVVRGYMQVDDDGARVAVREGRMIFDTANGVKSVKKNEQIILAMSDLDKKKVAGNAAPAPAPAAAPPAAASGFGAISTGGYVAIGAVAAVVVGIGVAAGSGGGGGGGHDPVPSPSK